MLHTDTPVIQRLTATIVYAKKKPAPFAKWIGATQSAISMILTGRNKTISSDLAEKITLMMPDIDPEWLMWGRGNMLRAKNSEKDGNKPEGAMPSASGSAPWPLLEEIEKRVADLEREVAALKKKGK